MGPDDGEFEAFAHAHLGALFGYAHYLAGNDHDAWDLVQEALTRMGMRWSSIDIDQNPVGYARTTIARLAVDRHRRSRRETPRDELPEARVEDRPLDGVDPWLSTALRALPPRQRVALVLRFVDDLDFASIAASMGCSVGTAKSQVSRGLARLREVAPPSSALALGALEDGHV